MTGIGTTILVCGGREFRDRGYVWRILDHVRDKVLKDLQFVIQGGAGGVDTYARLWAGESGLACATFHPAWKGMGKRAGPLRNRWMLTHGDPDLVVAFPGGIGTADMVFAANERGCKVLEAVSLWKPGDIL